MIAVDTDIPAALLPGNILRNGARVLKVRQHKDGDSLVVLCEKSAFVQDELVTWRADYKANTFWGHYFRNEEVKAVEDFLSR